MHAFQDTSLTSIPASISDADFNEIVRITLEASGIAIDQSKKPMIYSRLSRRLRELQLDSFSDYINLIKNRDSSEYTAFINTVTTNLTYFFREPHHFQFLDNTALPLLAKRNQNERKIRVWSSACSSGQEVYSIAMVLAENSSIQNWTKRILATDIDSDMVKNCASGSYSIDALRGLNSSQKKRWMQQDLDNRWEVNESLKKMVLAKKLNLFSDWPFRNGVDVIFCRNALIYFDEIHQNTLLKKFADYQTTGSYLFLGHSESIKASGLPYKRVSNTVYERM